MNLEFSGSFASPWNAIHIAKMQGPSVVWHLVVDDGADGGVHDKPDIGFDATDFAVGFIRSENISPFVGILVDKGFNADGGSLAVVSDLLVGDADVIQVPQSLWSFAKWKTKIDMKCQA